MKRKLIFFKGVCYCDFRRSKWDLFIDGKLESIDIDLGHEDFACGFVIQAKGGDLLQLGEILAGIENSLFIDSNNGSMPDDCEIAHHLNPNVDDRLANWDNDGASNISKSLGNTYPDISGANPALRVLYVGNRFGSDAHKHAAPCNVDHYGPKATIKAAMAAVQNNAVIIVMPGTEIYNERSRGAKGKRLTTRTVKPIIK